MEIPITLTLFGKEISIHFILETLAFFLAFRYYVYQKNKQDYITSENRLYIVLGATIGALIGSRLFGALENPLALANASWLAIYKSKTIIGGLIGGLFFVEITKKIVKEKQSSGDLFTLPLIVGIFIGRIGCFLTGTLEPTYGKETNFFMAMNLGDGKLRHPTALYEMFFLVLLFFVLKNIQKQNILINGALFKWFIVSYFFFRFLIEFIKPNEYLIYGLSTIQLVCIGCFLYYYKVILFPKSQIKKFKI